MATKPFAPNGIARIAFKVRWPGIAEQFGKDPDEEKLQELRVRITGKLISTPWNRYDRATGRDRSRWSPGIKPHRVVAYKLDGQEWVEIPPKPARDDRASRTPQQLPERP